jgi:hypothetical protein
VKEGLKRGVWVAIVALVVVTFARFKQVNAWWWGLNRWTRVALALGFTALIVGVGFYYKLG